LIGLLGETWAKRLYPGIRTSQHLAIRRATAGVVTFVKTDSSADFDAFLSTGLSTTGAEQNVPASIWALIRALNFWALNAP
jgi:hypothetical protein